MISSTRPLQEALPGDHTLPERSWLRPLLFRSDLWRAPLHDFPIRDEILFQFLPFGREMEVLEIGPGSGFTAFHLARQVRRLMLVDIADECIEELRSNLSSLSNLELVCANVCAPLFRDRVTRTFDQAFALDVFEYVPDPLACLRNLASVLHPEGELFLSYPNVPPAQGGDGVTYFFDLSELEALLHDAGFRRWEIFAVKMRPYAEVVYSLLHNLPLKFYRLVRRSNGAELPQTYEATWAFRHRGRLQRYRVLLNMLWAVIGFALRLGGDVFARVDGSSDILGKQLVIRAWR